MKYTTFRNLMIICGSVALLGSCTFCAYVYRSSTSLSTPEVASKRPSAEPSPVVEPSPVNAPPGPTSADNLRRIDHMVLEAIRRPVSGDKIKDAFPGEPFKINVYRDEGKTGWNRVKVDYNRNEKWDEKWELVAGQPSKRMVSSKDDEKYDEAYRWMDNKWIKQ